MHFDPVGTGFEVEPPHVAQQAGSRDAFAMTLGEPPQQSEFARVQSQPSPADLGVAMKQIERNGPYPALPRHGFPRRGHAARALAQLAQSDGGRQGIATPGLQQPRPVWSRLDAQEDAAPRIHLAAGTKAAGAADPPPGVHEEDASGGPARQRPAEQAQIPSCRRLRLVRHPCEFGHPRPLPDRLADGGITN